MSNAELLTLGTSRIAEAQGLPSPEARIPIWIELVKHLDEIERNVEDGAEVGAQAMRAYFTNVLAMGEALLRDLPANRMIGGAVENLRTRYCSAYGGMSEHTANRILDEVFGVA